MRWGVLTVVMVVATGCTGYMENAMRKAGTPVQRYDEFRDMRTVEVMATPVDGANVPGTVLSMGAIVTMAGPRHPEAPNTSAIFLAFMSRSPDWIYLRQFRAVDFIVDGEPLHLGEASHDGTTSVAGGRAGVSEAMQLKISRENLARIARGTIVRGQLGSTQFTVPAVSKENLALLLASVPPTVR